MALKVAVSCVLFQKTVDCAIKPVPVMFRVNEGPPAVASVGNRFRMMGVSLKGWELLLLQPPIRITTMAATYASADGRKRINSVLPWDFEGFKPPIPSSGKNGTRKTKTQSANPSAK